VVRDRIPQSRPAARWALWAIAAGAALLSASQWLHAPSVEYLIPLFVATAAALATAVRVVGVQRRWAIISSIFLAVAAAFAAPAQRGLWLVQHRWENWQRSSAIRGLEALRAALDEAVRESNRMANDALAAPRERDKAFGYVGDLVHGRDERGVVLYRGDSALAWGGSIRPVVDTSREGVTVVATPFYLGLQVLRRQGNARGIGVALIDAAPPADRLSTPLTQHLETQLGLSGFTFTRPIDSTTSPEILHYEVGGQRLFDVRHGIPHAHAGN